jgi:two-component system response regulator MprA
LKALAEEKKIFLIEDDPDIRESILEVLRTGGFGADSASTSREAIEKLSKAQPKPYLILLDLRLPGEDGFQFREEQMQHGDLADIPVVLLSADMQLKEKQDQLGAIDYLKKPVDIDELLDTVRRNCSA